MAFENWKVKKIDNTEIEILDGDRGKNYPNKKELFQTGHTLFLSNKNLHGDKLNVDLGEYISKEKDEALRQGKLVREDILMSTRGSVGNVGYFHKGINANNIRINSGMIIFRNKDKELMNDYLYHLLKSPYCKNQYIELTSGSVQNQLPIRDLRNLKLLIPSIKEQNEIVNILGALENKIDNNNSIISNLEKLAQTLFKRWFVDFEFPNENEEPYKSSGGEMVGNEFGSIPEGWAVGTASELFYFSPTTPLKKGEITDYVEMKDLNSSAVISSWSKREFAGSGSKFMNGDTLLARITPCLENGKIGFVDFMEEDATGWGSTEFITIRSKPGYSKTLSYFFASNPEFKLFAIKNMNGSSGRQRVRYQTLEDYTTVIPPKDIIEKFTSITDVMINKMSILRYQIKNVENLRDTLLPKLLSGEIELPDETEVNEYVPIS